MKTVPIALAKTSRPSLQGTVPRQRLYKLLDEGRQQKIIFVVGPPGSGKTTLIADYLTQHQLPSIWYQMDGGDNDVASFFHYLGIAAKHLTRNKLAALPHLTSEYIAGLSTFTRQYFRELFSHMPIPSVLVLDNYHEILNHSEFHYLLSQSLQDLPEQINVIIISRHKAPAALARFQANQTMNTIGWDELRLTPEEFDRFFQTRFKDNYCQGQSEDLYAKTEGWAAGLVLMHQRLIGDGSEQPLEPSREVLFDYFDSEIFQQTDQETQDILLSTSFLPSVTPEIAQQLSQSKQCAKKLAQLQRAHFFIEKLQHTKSLYQYHSLFREFLMTRAERVFNKEELSAIKIKAAHVLAENHQPLEAASLLIDTHSWPDLIQLLCQQGPILMNQGLEKSLCLLLKKLPKPITQHPWIAFWIGTTLLSSDTVVARQHLTAAYKAFKKENDLIGLFNAWTGAVDSIIYEWGDFSQLDYWINELENLLQNEPQLPSAEIEARVASSMFNALSYRCPSHPKLQFWEDKVIQMIRSPLIDLRSRLLISNHLVFYYTWTAQLAKIAVVFDVLKAVKNSTDIDPLTRIFWYSMEAMYGWLKPDLENSLAAVDQGLNLSRETGIHIWDIMLLAQGVYCHLSAGNLGEAEEFLQQMASRIVPQRYLDVAHFHYLSAWAAILQENIAQATQHMAAAEDASHKAGTPFTQVLLGIATAQVQFEAGDSKAALATLRKAKKKGVSFFKHHFEHHSLLCEAYFNFQLGKQGAGFTLLRQAFELARRENYFALTWWRPKMMRSLCINAFKADIETDYTRKLIRTQNLNPSAESMGIEQWPWEIQIYSLGQFTVLKRGQPIEFATKAQKRPLELLKVLVAFGGDGVNEQRLTETLWPQAEGDTAHRTFDTTLHRLRKMLGTYKIVHLQNGRLSLDKSYCWLDTWALDWVLSELDDIISGTLDEHRARFLVARLFKLYAGNFLGQEWDQPWALHLHERFRSRFLRKVAQLGDYWERLEQWSEAIECYQRGLEVDNLAEAFYQRLMICYKILGRHAEGVAVYLRCEKNLRSHSMKPSRATEEIYQEIILANKEA